MDDEIVTPENPASLVKLPWQEDVWLCPKSLLRWKQKTPSSWVRDYHGEADWEKMADYVGKTYAEVAQQELDYARSKTNA